MNKTKIDWADRTWNPVIGCLHDCQYCYARKIAHRFGGRWIQNTGKNKKQDDGNLRELGIPLPYQHKKGCLINAAYPFVFSLTFHRYRLGEPSKIKKPQNIFVCSMADLFGEWVPDEWIKAVFEACKKAPQHRYLFLTKNPERYYRLWDDISIYIPNNFWLGATITNSTDRYFYSLDRMQNSFLSIEPIHENLEGFDDIPSHRFPDWCIIGAETGNQEGKIIPKREWIENIIGVCRDNNIPVFMKNNLQDIWKEPLIQEYPWITAEAKEIV